MPRPHGRKLPLQGGLFLRHHRSREHRRRPPGTLFLRGAALRFARPLPAHREQEAGQLAQEPHFALFLRPHQAAPLQHRRTDERHRLLPRPLSGPAGSGGDQRAVAHHHLPRDLHHLVPAAGSRCGKETGKTPPFRGKVPQVRHQALGLRHRTRPVEPRKSQARRPPRRARLLSGQTLLSRFGKLRQVPLRMYQFSLQGGAPSGRAHADLARRTAHLVRQRRHLRRRLHPALPEEVQTHRGRDLRQGAQAHAAGHKRRQSGSGDDQLALPAPAHAGPPVDLRTA